MVKKIFSFILFIAIVLIIVVGFLFLKDRNKPIPEFIKGITLNTSFFITGNNFNNVLEELNENNDIFEELHNIASFSSLTTTVSFLDSVSQKHKEIRKLLHNKFAISANIKGKNDLEFIYLIRLENQQQQKATITTLLSLINNTLFAGESVVSQKKYSQATIYNINITYNSGSVEFFLSSIDGIIIISRSDLLIENTIRQFKSSNSILDISGFQKINKTAGENTDANIYINTKQFLKSVTSFENNKTIKTAINNVADWAELDLTLNTNNILLNGFTYSNDSLKNAINIFANQTPQKTTIHNILPANTSSFLYFSISNYALFRKNYIKYLSLNNKAKKFRNSLKSVENYSNTNIINDFINYFDGEVALAYTNFSNLSIPKNTFLVLKTKSKSKTEEYLSSLANTYSTNKKTTNYKLFKKYKIDEETNFEVFNMPFDGYGSLLFGDVFSAVKCNYFCFIDNYLVFGFSPEMLKTIVHSNILQKTLVNEQPYMNFYNDLSSKSNFYLYVDISKSERLINYYLSKNVSSIYNSSINSFNKFQSLGFQFLWSKEMYYNNILLYYNPIKKDNSKTVWESHLDATIQIKPRFLINHYTKNKEIFTQDKNNQIYLINGKGRVLWKKKLSEPILSKIYQVDAYKNGKLQILFNTKNYIHLIDRNGNYVERFPIKLSSSATNGISVFDYEKNKNYRIFLATKNKKIKVFNINGNSIPGWKFTNTEHIVNKEIQYFRVSNKDYLVFSDSTRVYILNRKGEERVKLKTQFSPSNNLMYIEKKNSKTKTRFVTTNNKGVVCYIYLNGKTETQYVQNCSKNHFFGFFDIDNDQFKDFVFLDKNQLTVVNRSKTKIFDYDFGLPINNQCLIYIFNKNTQKIGVISTEENKIFLINNKGELEKGFPLSGKTLFSIGRLFKTQKKYNLIVGGKDNFLYNYYLN